MYGSLYSNKEKTKKTLYKGQIVVLQKHDRAPDDPSSNQYCLIYQQTEKLQ